MDDIFQCMTATINNCPIFEIRPEAVHRNVVAAHCHVGEVTIAGEAGKKIRASVETFEIFNQFQGRARQRNDMFTARFHSLLRDGPTGL